MPMPIAPNPESWTLLSSSAPFGENLVQGFSVEYLGEQHSNNSCSHRDLGFAGSLAGRWYAVYGDTLWGAPGVSHPADDVPGFHGMVRNSVSALTMDPLVVHDLHLNDDSPVRHQLQFAPYKEEWGEKNTTGFGGTSIVETDTETGTGAVFFLVNHDEDYTHAGIARVQIIDGAPTVTERIGKGWWDTENNAKYGDIATYRDVNSEYIYVLGHPPKAHDKQWLESQYVYQARVKAREAFDLDKYEYWWGRQKGWSRDRLTTFTPETAVMWGVGQGQIVYSNYFQAYLYVHVVGATVTLRTAPKPEGPWSDGKGIYTATPIDGGFVYAGVAYPYLDESGKTLAMAYTNNNHIQVIKVTFS
ncbi:conserved secreted protein [Purpureocillium lavendulum]|uniref:Conserved secreted protein n=1 Tax=Purpureocillium lavendulum TaxID=1247861 RepID=A0AB34FDE0_9HYPO|nr:conserved secreted protein [Purpureocillium lavendulum]